MIFYLYAAVFLSVMNLTSIKILLPEIRAGLDVEINWLTWVVNAYSLPLAVFIPIAGKIGDLLGPRHFFIWGVFGLGLGSLVCGTAFSLPWLITGRAVQALGGALLVPNALAILLAGSTGNNRGRILGTWSSIGSSGAVFGPVASGLLIGVVSWRGSFLVIAALALAIALAAQRNMAGPATNKSTSPPEKRSFDLGGAALFMIATTVLLLGVTLLPVWGLGNTWIRVSLGFFVCLLYIFYRVERRAAEPMLDLALLKERRFSLGLLVGFLEQFVMAGTLFVLPIYFTAVRGHNAAVTALLLTPAAASVVFASPLGGRLADRFGPGPPITAGMLLRALSFLLLSRMTATTGYSYIAAALALNGIGFGFTTVPALNAVLSTVSGGRHGVASGTHNMVRFTGAAIGTTLGGIILYTLTPAAFTGLAGPIPGFREVYLLSAAACLPGLAAGASLYRAAKLPPNPITERARHVQ
ncbi:MAG: MFS transporter [Bacillota bacterium]